jgi:hypothetical protein
VRPQSIDKLIELTFHDEIELMDRHADAMIGDAILFEIISPDLFRSVAASDHRLPFARLGVVLFLLFELLQPARKTRIAFSRFFICDFSSCIETTTPDGRCVIRTAE